MCCRLIIIPTGGPGPAVDIWWWYHIKKELCLRDSREGSSPLITKYTRR